MKRWEFVMGFLWAAFSRVKGATNPPNEICVLGYTINGYFINNAYLEFVVEKDGEAILTVRDTGNDSQIFETIGTFFKYVIKPSEKYTGVLPAIDAKKDVKDSAS